VGREVAGVELGTAVIPTYPRHPLLMAQQALTAQAATGGRFAGGDEERDRTRALLASWTG
jgi:alkanesulfonate monooxygenase SsuD/methylene tetrahydromethanopterin reductase-like flavin-dependent oxidoreductase (luciferase family)